MENFKAMDHGYFSGLISDTYTLLAGFVAIGIPLAIQTIEKSVNKYDSKYLIKYMVSWNGGSPKIFLYASLIYVLWSLNFQYFGGSLQESFCTVHSILSIITLVYFSVLFLFVVLWYARIMKLVGMDEKELISQLRREN